MKPGYKQTEVGMIPEEWEVMSLGQMAELTSSKRIFESDYVPFGIPFYRGKEISMLVEGEVINDVYYISEARFEVIRAKFGAPVCGDILITAVGTLANVYVVNSNEPFYFKDGNLIWLRGIKYVEAPFLGIQLRRAKATILDGAIGTSQKALTIVVMRTVKVALPPLPEQRAIAAALSDVDALLAGLERLIAKKRDLKQAAMQQLLTGQTRLPGFHGAWEVVSAREIGVFRGGSGFSLEAQGELDGEYPFFKVSDMNTQGNETFMNTSNHRISENTRKKLGATAFPTNAIVLAKVGAAIFLERKKILAQPSCIDNNMAAFVLNQNKADVRFIHTLLLNKKIGSIVATSALPSLNAKQLGDMLFKLPTSLPEQIAIAAVLSDMDAELAALDTQLHKTRAIKQGMMQELLTGRTRLMDN